MRDTNRILAVANLLGTALFAAAAWANAGEGNLVTVPMAAQGSSPADLTVSGDYLYFSADDGVHGRELWKLDKDGETSLVVDLNPGPADGNPHSLEAAGSKLYFFSSINHLWVTEGTPLTTRRVEKTPLEPIDSVSLGDKMVFLARDSAHGVEIWSTSGLPNSTHLLHELKVGPESSLGDWFTFLPISFDGHAFFVMNNQVWRTDGTSSGTKLLPDENGDPVRAYRIDGVIFEDSMFFTADSPQGKIWEIQLGEDVARSADQATPQLSGAPNLLGRAGSNVIFHGKSLELGSELWVVNPSPGYGALVVDIFPGPLGSKPYAFTPLNEKCIFIADHPDTGIELWQSDGTVAGTGLLKDLVEGPLSSDPYQLTSYKGWVLFSCENYLSGEELWRTDGTEEGTILVRDINPEGDSEPYNLTEFNEKVYFTANHHIFGEELWESDGTAEGTRLTARIKPGLRSTGSSFPRDLTAHEGILYFSIINEKGCRELWTATGSTARRSDVFNNALELGESITGIRAVQETLIVESRSPEGKRAFHAIDSSGNGVQKVDVNPIPTKQETLRELLGDVHYTALLPRTLREDQWGRVGESVCFVAYTPDSGAELWVFNARDMEPELLLDIIPGPASSSPGGLIATGKGLIFWAEDINKGCEMWITDGTSEGTRLVADFNESPRGSMPDDFLLTDKGLLFFVGQIWPEGYHLLSVDTLYLDFQNSYLNKWQEQVMRPFELTAVGDTVYFVSKHPLFGEELWRVASDNRLAAEPSVELVRDIRPSKCYDEPSRAWVD